VIDGNTVLENLKKEKVDLIVADWYMPNRNGRSLFKALREEELWKDIPFLIITMEKYL
tara:strand:- start:30 stop:203 length:174 start_codon:yes stop_codon:yes gene_type:complete